MKKLMPILFNEPMALAIAEGRKTQTRRFMDIQPIVLDKKLMSGREALVLYPNPTTKYNTTFRSHEFTREDYLDFCPYGKRDDVLYVRETMRILPAVEPYFVLAVQYKCDMETTSRRLNFRDIASLDVKKLGAERWTPPMHMPRWASRSLLEITKVKVQRLSEISEEDAIEEGFSHDIGYMTDPINNRSARDNFLKAMESNKYRNQDPFVWVIKFKRKV